MSATILDPAHPQRERSGTWGPPTEDLESTTDVHEENTTDLAPATQDVTPDEAPPEVTAEDVAIALSPAPVAAGAPAERAPAARTQPPSGPATSAAEARVEKRAPEKAPPVAPKPPRMIVVAPGTVLCDRYLIEQMIGRGGTALVFRARDMTSSRGSEPNREIAIKTPRPELADRPRAITRLRHEFEHAKRLSHPNIVRVTEFHDDPLHCFIAMELIEGRLLSSLIRDWTMLAPPLTQKILRDCAQALTYAHRHGVVHGDFKPGNVFVTADEEIKVVDFGASALTLAPDESRIAAGTPAYASPEVLSGAAPEPRDDVFSFACVAYELLTGQHPFDRKSSLNARSEGVVPQRAWSLGTRQWLALLAALSWERAQRPGDIETLMAALTSESSAPCAAPPVHAAPAAALSTELRAELMPRPSSWGFFVFIACAIAIIVIAIQRPRQAAPTAPRSVSAGAPHALPLQATPAATAQQSAEGGVPTSAAAAQASTAPGSSASTAPRARTPAMAAAKPAAATRSDSKVSPPAAAAAASAGPSRAPSSNATTAKAAPAKAAPVSARPAGAVSQLSFESRSVVTTESSVAAVFVIRRSPPLTGRVRVQWVAESGTAQAGVDFAANARGTVEFADGQAQRAIYVPLRNDLVKEDDKKFTVRLQSAQGAKLGAIAQAEATIRDDD
jgi:Protein kinase domain/Calx-beta domain